MKAFQPVILFLSLLFLSCGSLRLRESLTQSTADWPMYGKDPTHGSAVNFISTRLEGLWKHDVGAGFGNFSPTIVNGIVFVGSLKGDVFLLDVETGDKEGTRTFGGAIFSSPIICDSMMIVASSESKDNLFAYDLVTGKVIWSKQIADVESSSAILDGALYVSTVRGDLYKFESKTGREIFHKELPAPVRVAPAVDDSLCVLGCDDGNIYAMSSHDGREIWKYDAGSPVWCSASMSDSLVFVGTNAGKLLVLKRNGALNFDFSTNGKILSMPICDGKGVYFGSDDGNFYAVSASDGALLWKVQTDAPIVASAAQTESQVIFGGFDEELYVVEKSDGKVDQKIDLEGRVRTSPAIYRDYLVVCAENSNVFGFRIR